MTRLPLVVLGIAPIFGLGLALVSTIARADPAQTTEARAVAAFHAVDLAGAIEVDVDLGKSSSVAITGDADLVGKVTTTVKDGVLVIDTRDLRHPPGRAHVHLRAIVTAPDLGALTISGAGTMQVAGIANDHLTLDLPGAGTLTATGSTGELHVTVGGSGDVRAKGLAAKDVVVTIPGVGDAALRATRSVDATIAGTGSIRVEGHPTQIRKSVSGIGSIHVK